MEERSARIGAGAQQLGAAAASIPQRMLDLVLAAAAEPGSVTTLLGEPGSGKAFIAEHAADALISRLPGPVHALVLPRPPRPGSGIASVFAFDFEGFGAEGDAGAFAELGPVEHARGVVRRLGERFAGDAVILVAPDIDDYTPQDLRVLEGIARSGGLRIIATARHVTPAIERIGHGPRVRRVAIGPLEPAEAERYLARLLGVDRIEAETLQYWTTAARGNSYALSMLALAADRAGEVRRSRGTAWVASRDGRVPGELARLLGDTCAPEEWGMLERIALAEPIREAALLCSLDTGVLARLLDRGMVVAQPSLGGSAVGIAHPLLGASIRAGLSPIRRIQLNDRIFRVLEEDLGALDPVQLPDRLMRLVVFGLEGGRELPYAWLWTALEFMARGGDPRLMLRLAQAIAAHPAADAAQAGSAALRATRIARLLGDDAARRAALARIAGILADEVSAAELPESLRVGLVLTAIRERIREGGDPQAALDELDALAAEHGDAAATPVAEMIRSTRVHVLAYSGRLREAAAACPPLDTSPDLHTEWARSPGRAMAALILEQRGAIEEAISSAEHARALSRLGPHLRSDLVDVQGFCWLLGYWVSGSAETARRVYEALVAEASADAHAEAHYSGLVETGAVLLGIQEGRWGDAAMSAERLTHRLAEHDGYGLTPLVQAALGLALAVLGEAEPARRAIHAAGHVPRVSREPSTGTGACCCCARGSGCATRASSPRRSGSRPGRATRSWRSSSCRRATRTPTRSAHARRRSSGARPSSPGASTPRSGRRCSDISSASAREPAREPPRAIRRPAASPTSASGCRCLRPRSSRPGSGRSCCSPRWGTRVASSRSACTSRRARSRRTSGTPSRSSGSPTATNCAAGRRGTARR
ncbi:hypothetical protein MUN78_00295 [Leucobacter allii]|uniref:AAA+ ATPase domain-containing protein n=1 Tax=Leucobacter allii TaxID=2932247 RepID=A0ABY4FM23_9MICO|nr:hypothetical protein [Leucobacter allii]UOQ57320.1 hypothetical protein MUN78_00295 [Leucobacter allii]